VTRDVATTPAYPAGAAHSSWPFILAVIGGVLVLIEGIIIAVAGPLVMVTGGDLGLGVLIFGMAVIILGLVMLWLALGLRQNPARHVAFGAGLIIVSVIALVLAGGGFVIGSIMGIIGGAWAIMGA
jgi:hypothetical protein